MRLFYKVRTACEGTISLLRFPKFCYTPDTACRILTAAPSPPRFISHCERSVGKPGTAAQMFSIAGPVLVYGTATSVVYGLIYYLVTK